MIDRAQHFVRQRATASGALIWRTRRRRQLLNAVWTSLPHQLKSEVHSTWASSLVGRTDVELGGAWVEDFAGGEICVPMDSADIGERWNFALSLTGHDVGVKNLYRRLLLDAAQSPMTFFDVGCNLGTHSLLFLGAGVRTISFEPNPICHEFLREICAASGLTSEIEGCCLGDTEGVAILRFPPGESWLGTTNVTRAEELSRGHVMSTIEVPTTTLDGFVERTGTVPTLVKIDTEGNETAVLRGAERTLVTARPLVVFECWPSAETRRAVAHQLHAVDYRIYTTEMRSLSTSEFLRHSSENFCASPAG